MKYMLPNAHPSIILAIVTRPLTLIQEPIISVTINEYIISFDIYVNNGVKKTMELHVCDKSHFHYSIIL